MGSSTMLCSSMWRCTPPSILDGLLRFAPSPVQRLSDSATSKLKSMATTDKVFHHAYQDTFSHIHDAQRILYHIWERKELYNKSKAGSNGFDGQNLYMCALKDVRSSFQQTPCDQCNEVGACVNRMSHAM